MKLGLIGKPLGHSWSPEIHAFITKQDYQLYELEEDEMHQFLHQKDFDGLNVTIPYKQKVMADLDEIDPLAKEIGAVNCIVNENGRLKGYNTDIDGFMGMLRHNNIDVKGKKAAVLGSGGASKAAVCALKHMQAEPYVISRSRHDNTLTYDELYDHESEFQIIVNATPVGMKPDYDDVPVDIRRFTHLQAVADIVANPLRTRLQFDAKMLGIPYCGGFEMLVGQAFAADELFTHQKLDEQLIPECMKAVLRKRRNIVLIGMPTSGKSTIAAVLGKRTGAVVVEMDEEIEKEIGMSISECFKTKGESYFRNIEKEVAKKHREANGEILSCGGGVIKNPDTMRYLSENGLVIWIERNLNQLFPTDSRPLAGSEQALQNLYQERLPLYQKYSDLHIDNNGNIEDTISEILSKTGWEA